MAKLTLQQVSNILSKSAITKLNPSSAIASTAFQIGRDKAKESYGYDFVGLLVKLFVFYTIAFVFAKFMEGVIYARGAFTIIANTLGFNIPSSEQLPQSLKDLFGEQGVKGFKFWDIIKIISILLVTAEFFSYLNSVKTDPTKKSSPMTIGLFTLIILALGLTTVSELMQRVKGTDFNSIR